jgi:hypothetical protein
VRPPSTAITAPVMKLALGVARKAMMSAISAGWAARASSVVSPSAAMRSGDAPWV